MVRRLLAFGVVLLIAASAQAEPQQLANGVWLQKGHFAPGSQPDGNSVIFEGSKGLMIVDTGRHESHTLALLDFAASRKKKIAAIVNTHWHLDHIGGNARIRERHPAARIYATDTLEGALDGFLARYRAQLIDIIPKTTDAEQQMKFSKELALIDGAEKLAPNEMITRSGKRSIGGRPFEVFVSNRAATEADLWLLDAKSGVLVAGDLITLPAPFLDTACPKGMLTALDRISETRFQTVVPGHGTSMNREEFARYRGAFAELLSCAESESDSKACGEKWISTLGDQIPESEREFARELMNYYIENHLRGDPAQTVRLCGG